MNLKGRLYELDCLRGVAILAVILCHFTLSYKLSNYGLKFGSTGVDLFFIISGFVIFFTIENTVSLKDFLVSRFARLFPAYWVCVSITTIVIISYTYLTHQPLVFPHIKDYLVNLTMTQDFFKIRKIDGAYWSLTIELMFYFFVSVVYLFNKLNKIEFIGYITLSACLLNNFLFKQQVPQVFHFLSDYFSIVYDFPLFIAGIMFYKIKFYGLSYSRITLIALSYLAQVALWEPTGGHVLETRFQYSIIILVYFLLFLLFCFNRLSFIINKSLLFFGKISYSLYLIHSYIFASLLTTILVGSKHMLINPYIAIFFISLPAAVAVATLVNKYVEIPARRYIRSKWKVKKSPGLNNVGAK